MSKKCEVRAIALGARGARPRCSLGSPLGKPFSRHPLDFRGRDAQAAGTPPPSATRRRARNNPGGESIEDRPDLSGRAEFGHWEMDTIVSRVGGHGGLLVLIERKTRRYLVRKLPVLSQDAVLRLLRRLCASGTMGRVLSVTTALQCFLQESA